MTYISSSENLQGKVEHLFTRPERASKSVENCFRRLELQKNKSQIVQKDRFVEFSFNDSDYLENVEEYNYNDVTARLESVNYVAPQPPEGGVDTQVKIINYVYDTEKDQLTSVNLDNSTLSYEVLVSVVNPEIYPKLAELQYDGGLLLSENSSTYNSKLEWVYDDDLRVKSIKLTTNGDISSASMSDYLYNDDNQLISAGDMAYSYDNNGFLSQTRMLSGAETPFSEISDSNINPVRHPKSAELQTYDYNDYGEIISTINGKHDTESSSAHSFSYTYDGVGRIKEVVEGRGTASPIQTTGFSPLRNTPMMQVSVTNINPEIYPKPA